MIRPKKVLQEGVGCMQTKGNVQGRMCDQKEWQSSRLVSLDSEIKTTPPHRKGINGAKEGTSSPPCRRAAGKARGLQTCQFLDVSLRRVYICEGATRNGIARPAHDDHLDLLSVVDVEVLLKIVCVKGMQRVMHKR